MGSFANSMFSALLGWIRTAALWLWNTFFNAEDGGLIGWIGENWVGLIISLSIVCMAVDVVIHLLRWRPYKVWISFLRRLMGKGGTETHTQFSGRMSRVWHYADGTAREEEVLVPQDEWYDQEDEPEKLTRRVAARRYARTLARAEKLNYQQEMKKEQPVQGLEDYPQPLHTQEEPAAPAGEPRMERLRKRMARLTAPEQDDELQLRYRPAPPAVDKREAYRAPYYPPQWKMPAAIEEETDDNAL